MKIVRILILGLFVFTVSLFIYYGLVPAVTEETGVIYDLKKGATKHTIIADFAAANFIKFPSLFSLLVYAQPNKHLKAGEYLFPKGSTAFTIWHQITHGIGIVNHAFTIVPGWTFKQLRQALAENPNVHHTIEGSTDNDIMLQLGYGTLSPEGQFFAETYYYNKHNSDLIILQRALTLMQTKLNEAWKERDPDLPYNHPYEALIAASLIEKEAYRNIERPMIAGVLVNRIKKNMLLQFDPTIIYGLGERYDGKIYKDNLLEDTPYNTYKHKGLPPTPIAIPSAASILAALHPEKHDYFYFVARKDGSHQFSKTLPEHHVAVATEQKPNPEFFNDNKVKHYLNKITHAPK